jgi:hypothetical protein
MVVMPSMVMESGSIRGNDRTGKNRECNGSEQEIAEYLHRENPHGYRPPHPSGRSGECMEHTWLRAARA